MSYMHVVLRDTFVPSMHMDLGLFLNILVFKQIRINGIADSSKEALNKKKIFNVFKGEF